jgi:branched-chain amino acid transport system permease protein
VDRFVISVVGGGSLGGTYALIGLGLVLAYRATGTFNFAHGELMLLPAFLVGRWQSSATGPFWLGVITAFALTAAVCVAFYLLVLARIAGLPPFMGVIATLGLAAVLDGAMAIVYGSSQYKISLDWLPHGVVRVFGARVSSLSLTLTGVTLVLAVGVALVLRHTRIGLQITAAGQNPLLASQRGIPVRRLYVVSWAVAGVLASIAGIAYGATNIVDPSIVNLALAAFPAILLGGLDSAAGAIVGGVTVGILQGFTATYLGGQYLQVLTYALLLIVLLVYPQGLFGTKVVSRV